MLLYEEESYKIRGACFTVYSTFRNTQKEIVYQNALSQELQLAGIAIEQEKELPIFYKGQQVGKYRPDIVVNNVIILELKAKPFLHKDDIRQFWYYLKNSEYSLGFLVNFGEPNGVRIIRRIYDETRRRSVSLSA